MENEYFKKYIEELNNSDMAVRLESLKKLMKGIENGILDRPVTGNDVNNHIHTCYSFSPYSPSRALWTAYNAGLITAGIVDHDSVSGVEEFIMAGEIIGMATTIGVECRVNFSKTPLAGRRINNPDQKSIAYVLLHGIPHTQIRTVKEYFMPYMEARHRRNRLMTDKINGIISSFGLKLDYDSDIVTISKSSEGGSTTERHILYALALKMIEKYGKGEIMVNFLTEKLLLNISTKTGSLLLQNDNPHYAYDLLGALKSEMVSAFYIDADEECPDVEEFMDFSRQIGAISAYAYLGDVGDSITGDKKTQKFEDDYIGLLFDVLEDLGFNAVTYMPSRNTMAQLLKVRSFCEKYGFMQISGEDINSPRQKFVCEALRNPEFKNLIDSTWALIGHEYAATVDLSQGMFAPETLRKYPDLNERISIYKKLGRSMPGKRSYYF